MTAVRVRHPFPMNDALPLILIAATCVVYLYATAKCQ